MAYTVTSCNNSGLLLPAGPAGVANNDATDTERGNDVVVAAHKEGGVNLDPSTEYRYWTMGTNHAHHVNPLILVSAEEFGVGLTGFQAKCMVPCMVPTVPTQSAPVPVSAVEVLQQAPPLCKDLLESPLGCEVLLVDLQVPAELLHAGSEPGHLVLGGPSVLLMLGKRG